MVTLRNLMYFCIRNKKLFNYDNSNDRIDCTAYHRTDWLGNRRTKDKCVTFVHSEEEAEGEEEMKEAYEAHGGRELNLKDLLAHNSTNGYKSI